jgi:hypothetical protein
MDHAGKDPTTPIAGIAREVCARWQKSALGPGNVSVTGQGSLSAFFQAISVRIRPGSHTGFAISDWFKSGLCTALFQPLRILDRTGSEFSVGDSELGAVQLRPAGIDPHPVLQVGQVRRRRLPCLTATRRACRNVRCRTGSRSAS